MPFVVTGFEPYDLIQGITMAVRQLKQGEYKVENQYKRAVKRDGNNEALDLLEETFDICDRYWRGIGNIARSGYQLKDKYALYDAEKKFGIPENTKETADPCIAADILTGRKKPEECPSFGNNCTPEHPLGPMMVSSEGSCAACYRYGLE
jgi:hydrogenase expression/formation protein HypD